MTTDCKTWERAKSDNGYGYVRVGDKTIGAHRHAYLTEVGDIPEGWTIDHLCRNKLCVNVEHLEAVPHKINTQRRSEAIWKDRNGKCKHGHSADNIFLNSNNKRSCRECLRQGAQKFRRKSK